MTKRLLLAGLVAGSGASYAMARRRRGAGEPDLFRDRVALVMGGSRGLGFLLGRELVRRGSRVALAARDSFELQGAQAELRAEGADVFIIPCDVTDRSRVEAVIREVERSVGPIDLLLNNSGTITVGPIETMTVEDYERSFAVMLWGMVYATLAVLPGMMERRRGRIVNISSIGGRLSVPHLNPYCASKFAATGFSEGMRAELRRHGIRVTTVLPGLMRTGGHVNAEFKGHQREEYRWFALSASMPGISMDAEKAARRIVEAVRRGDADCVVGFPAKLAAFIHGLAPGTTADAAGVVARRFLPDVTTGRERVKGRYLERKEGAWLWRALTSLGRESVSRFQEFRASGASFVPRARLHS
ncbi:MAG TPA: SDR family NAD(P)-dependent oxidoreductase [Vicinamibacteria bacterium]|nr:SDR family NAD(P)-dependent oxidoreductase [Vicinamibacteria bacterium]